MNSYFIGILLSTKTGFVFSRLIFDVFALLLILNFTVKVILPIIRKYRLALYLDRTCGSEPRHWLYGHLKIVSFSGWKFNFVS